MKTPQEIIIQINKDSKNLAKIIQPIIQAQNIRIREAAKVIGKYYKERNWIN